MTGNKISYYDRNFFERQYRDKDIQADWVYAIWTLSNGFHVASFKTEEQLKAFADKIGFSYTWDSEREDGYKEGHTSVDIHDHAQDEEVLDIWRRYMDMAFQNENEEEKKQGKKWLATHFDDKCQAYCMTSEHMAIAKPIKALSNGSIVDCYYINNGKDVKFYRCNPNAKKFYKPLPLDEHIAYQKKYGSF